MRGALIWLESYKRFLTMAALVILLVLLLMTFSGCTPRTVRPSLPAQADPRPLPEWKGKTYRDLTNYVWELRESCTASEADKTVIREMYSDE